MELMQASRQWASRPADERFTSLTDMLEHFRNQRANSREVVVSSRRLQAVPQADHKGLLIEGPNGHGYAPSHWSFGQLAQLADAPASYLRKLPAELAADCINLGLRVLRDVERAGLAHVHLCVMRDIRAAATRAQLLEAIDMGKRRVAHIAGHGYGDVLSANHWACGWWCAARRLRPLLFREGV